MMMRFEGKRKLLDTITLLGSSSGRNAGDAAILSGIMDTVDAACGTPLAYEIPTLKPAFIRDAYANRTRPIGMMPWNGSVKMLGLPTYRSVMRTHYTLIFDAILFDRSLYNPLFNFLSTLYLLLPRARRKGKRMACFNVGAGPVDTPAGRRMLRAVADCMDFITVRDQESMDILRDVGAQTPRILLAADAAVNVTPAPEKRVDAILGKLGLSRDDEILAVNVNQYLDTWARPKREPMGKEQFLQILSAAVNQVADETGAAVLCVPTQHHDVPITEEFMARLTRARAVAMVANRDFSHYEIKGVLGACSMLLAMRLHASILGASALAPTLGLAYQPKVEFFYNQLGMPERNIRFDRFTVEDLRRHLLQGWADRNEIRRQLEVRIPPLQQDACKAANVVASIRRGEDMDEAFSRAAGHST
jgi:polysaccharide pyruvyl transferase WcaK-like protein